MKIFLTKTYKRESSFNKKENKKLKINGTRSTERDMRQNMGQNTEQTTKQNTERGGARAKNKLH